MKIAVTGSTGLIGTSLTTSLRADGHEVVPVVRRPVPAGEVAVRWDPTAGAIDAEGLEGVEAVVHLAGAGIGDKRWTDDYKRVLLESRTHSTDLISRTIVGLRSPPDVLVSASGINYYGDTGDTSTEETAPPGDDFLASVCVRWEGAADPARDAGIRVAHIRTGMVLSPNGGALTQLLPLFKIGLGGRMGSGRQWWSWISIDDEVAAIRWLIDRDVDGPVNLVAPQSTTNADFTRTLATVLHRPALLPIPAFGPKLVKGGELADSLLFTSQRIVPAGLRRSGFEFSHPDLEGALRHVLDRPRDDAQAA